MQWKADPPFVSIDVEELGTRGKEIFESFKAYVESLDKVVKVQLPDILTKAEAIVNELEDVQANAQDQFAALGLVEKAKAAKALMMNVRSTTAIPAIIKQALEDFKGDLLQIQDAGNEVKNNITKIKS